MPTAGRFGGEHRGPRRSYASSLWAVLLARIYEVFPLVCPHCGAPMRIIAFVTDTASVTHILRHLGEPTQPPPVSPARGPPQWEESFDQSPVYTCPRASGSRLRIRPDHERVSPRHGACPRGTRQRSRSSPGKHPNRSETHTTSPINRNIPREIVKVCFRHWAKAPLCPALSFTTLLRN